MNQVCIDLGTEGPQWASVSHGCYISLESSGVHRSLGVHVSFVRSTTMDSWKPSQLKMMELGGNAKLKAFFKEHNVPESMAIAQKYNTRAADWYRKNLRALAEGTDPPSPLPEGEGHLPVEGYVPQVAYSSSTTGGDSGEPAPPAPQRKPSDASDGPAAEEEAESSSASPSGPPQRPIPNDDLIGAVFGEEVGSKVSGGLWTALGAAKTIASKAKTFAETKKQQAQQEGWIDTVVGTAKQGVAVTVDTTQVLAQKGLEAGQATAALVNEGGGKAVIGKTTEAAKTGVDWVADRLNALAQQGDQTAAGLQAMSSGRMEGFGSDNAAPASSAAAPATATPAGLSHMTQEAVLARRSYHEGGCDDRAAALQSMNAAGAGVDRPCSPRIAAAKAELWNDDDDWGDMN